MESTVGSRDCWYRRVSSCDLPGPTKQNEDDAPHWMTSQNGPAHGLSSNSCSSTTIDRYGKGIASPSIMTVLYGFVRLVIRDMQLPLTSDVKNI